MNGNLPFQDDFTDEFSRLLAFVSKVAIAIRMYSKYGNPNDPNGPEDVRWLSDSLHNLAEISEAIRLGRKDLALTACEFNLSVYRGYQNMPTFIRNDIVPLDDAILIFEGIKRKLMTSTETS